MADNINQDTLRIEEKKEIKTEAEREPVLKDGDNTASYFTNLPISQLICEPFIAIAKGQMELCMVYIDTLFKIAFNSSASSLDEANETRILQMKYSRPVIDETTGEFSTKDFYINAPLLSLVPIPAFTMDSADVDFDMEVNIANNVTDTQTQEATASANFSFWTCKCNVSGKVSNNRTSAFSNSQKATYRISVHASQQAPAEGMAKLTALLAETMEPITMKA